LYGVQVCTHVVVCPGFGVCMAICTVPTSLSAPLTTVQVKVVPGDQLAGNTQSICGLPSFREGSSCCSTPLNTCCWKLAYPVGTSLGLPGGGTVVGVVVGAVVWLLLPPPLPVRSHPAKSAAPTTRPKMGQNPPEQRFVGIRRNRSSVGISGHLANRAPQVGDDLLAALQMEPPLRAPRTSCPAQPRYWSNGIGILRDIVIQVADGWLQTFPTGVYPRAG
jgi:hypothetical protein